MSNKLAHEETVDDLMAKEAARHAERGAEHVRSVDLKSDSTAVELKWDNSNFRLGFLGR